MLIRRLCVFVRHINKMPPFSLALSLSLPPSPTPPTHTLSLPLSRWLTSSMQGEELSLGALCALHGLCTHPRSLEGVEVEQLHSVSLQLATWLKQASKSSLPAPTTGISIFGGGGKKQVQLVYTVQGSCRIFFRGDDPEVDVAMGHAIFPRSASYLERCSPQKFCIH